MSGEERHIVEIRLDPVPSEATEAGEEDPCDTEHPNAGCADVGCKHNCEEWSRRHGAAEPDAGEVEALAQHIYEASDCYEEDGTGWENQHGSPRREAMTQARAILASDWLAALLDRVRREAKAEGHRAGYETARGDLVSGAFVGGPTYQALRDSFTGKQIVKEALTEAADEMPHTRLAAHWLRDRAADIARSTP